MAARGRDARHRSSGSAVRQRAGAVCMAAGAVLLVAAAGLFAFNQVEARRANAEAAYAFDRVAACVEDAAAADVAANPYDSAMPQVEIDGVAYVGYLLIPDAGVRLPVTAAWDYGLLKQGACRYAGSVRTHDLVIAAHNYALDYLGVFGPAPQGAKVYLATVDGACTVYEVATTEVLEPDAVDAMVRSPYDLTVFSCTYDGSRRVAVRCVEV